MAEPQRFDFDAPIEASVPFQGSSPAATHASWTGARVAVDTLPARVSAYLQLLEQSGALTDHEAAALLRCQLCSVNSVRGWIRKYRRDVMIVSEGFDAHTWTDGSGRQRTTRRTRWRLAKR
jgi:hypothetical protein